MTLSAWIDAQIRITWKRDGDAWHAVNDTPYGVTGTATVQQQRDMWGEPYDEWGVSMQIVHPSGTVDDWEVVNPPTQSMAEHHIRDGVSYYLPEQVRRDWHEACKTFDVRLNPPKLYEEVKL